MMVLAQLLFSSRAMRPSELMREIPDVSQKMLVQQLRALESEGIVARTAYPSVPPKVDYHLTALGGQLEPVFVTLMGWADLKQGETATT